MQWGIFPGCPGVGDRVKDKGVRGDLETGDHRERDQGERGDGGHNDSGQGSEQDCSLHNI